MSVKDKKLTTAKVSSDERMLVKGPRLSEKAIAQNKLGKYVFVLDKGANKLQAKRHLEALYGILVQSINMVKVNGRSRRYGKSKGRTVSFKKAIITLAEGSAKPETLEAT